MKEILPLNELFSEDEINKIIDTGVSLASERAREQESKRARDEGIEFEVKYNLNNGNNHIVDEYAQRLNTDTLTAKELSVINKYKDSKSKYLF